MFVVKEDNYNMTIMSTHSGLVVHEGQKEEYIISKVKVYTLQYEEQFSHN